MFRIFAALLLALSFLGCVGHQPKPVTVTSALAGIVADAAPVRPAKAVLHADKAFTAEEQKVLLDAATVWQRQTSGVAQITVLFDVDFDSALDLESHIDAEHHILMKAESWFPWIQEMEESDSHLLGFVRPSGGIHNPIKLKNGHQMPLQIVFVVDRFTHRDMALQVMVHEFGHVLGMPHTPAFQSVMYPSYYKGKTSCLKMPDLAMFCQVNACGAAKMLPCE